MTVTEAMNGEFNALGHQLKRRISETCNEHDLAEEPMVDLFLSACGEDELSDVKDYMKATDSLTRFVLAVEFSLNNLQRLLH